MQTLGPVLGRDPDTQNSDLKSGPFSRVESETTKHEQLASNIVFQKLFCSSQLPHKSVNSCITLLAARNKLTDCVGLDLHKITSEHCMGDTRERPGVPSRVIYGYAWPLSGPEGVPLSWGRDLVPPLHGGGVRLLALLLLLVRPRH